MAVSDQRGLQSSRTGSGEWAKAFGDQVWHLSDAGGRVAEPLCGRSAFGPAQRLSRANMGSTVPAPVQCQWCRDVARGRAAGGPDR